MATWTGKKQTGPLASAVAPRPTPQPQAQAPDPLAAVRQQLNDQAPADPLQPFAAPDAPLNAVERVPQNLVDPGTGTPLANPEEILPAMPESAPLPDIFTGPADYARDPGSMVRTREGHLADLTDRGDLRALPGEGGYDDEIKRIVDATYGRGYNLLSPEFQRQEDDIEAMLAQRGLGIGSEAYRDAYSDFRADRDRSLTDLSLASVLAGAQEHGRLADLDLRARGQDWAERLGIFDAGGDVFAEGMDANRFLADERQAQFDRELGLAEFGQRGDIERMRLETQRQLQQAGFDHETAQQMSRQMHESGMQRAGFTHAADLQRQGFLHEGTMQQNQAQIQQNLQQLGFDQETATQMAQQQHQLQVQRLDQEFAKVMQGGEQEFQAFLQAAGFAHEGAMQENEILARQQMQQAGFDFDTTMQELQADLQREGWDFEKVMQEASQEHELQLLAEQAQIEADLAEVQRQHELALQANDQEHANRLFDRQVQHEQALARVQGQIEKRKARSSLLGSIIGGAFAFFSDRRLKRNIQRIGRLANGLWLYAYEYIWGGPRQIGLMADEVERVRPEAVVSLAGGFKGVIYPLAVV